jgi:MIP family channel proteins
MTTLRSLFDFPQMMVVVSADRNTHSNPLHGDEIMSRKLIAELIGTFTLIFIGAGAGAIGAGGLVGVALAHGFVVLAFAYAYGHISGTHINPAVTIGLWAGKQIDAVTAAGYIVVQLIGGTLGAFALRSVLGGAASGLGATTLAASVTPVQGFVVELLLTFFLVNTIFNTAVSGKAGNLAPVAIGLTLVFAILMGGPLTGASLNPARTLGPAIMTGNYANLSIYLIAPPLGAILAALLYQLVLKERN